MKKQYPRLLAVRVITRVLSDREALDDALASVSGQISPESFGWLQDICSGTLRWKGRLDFILDSVSLKKRPSGWLRKILLVAAYQLIVQDRVHAGAVVSETVSEIKAKEGVAPSRFANACLRKIADHALVWREATPEVFGNDAAWSSLPDWLWHRIRKDHGLEWAKAYAQAVLERPSLWIRARDQDWAPDWAEAGPVPQSWKVNRGGNVTRLPGFQEGEWIVQDISSQVLISEVLKRIRRIREDQPVRDDQAGREDQTGRKGGAPLRALDLCAAPGGKSVGMSWSGVEVTATDISEKRRVLLHQTVERADPGVKIIPWEDLPSVDSIDGDVAPDLIWLDAPCSGTGIIRRHPDVRWIRAEKDVEALAITQEQLVRDAWNRLKPGSFLVYSVCSVLAAEGPEIIRRVFLKGTVENPAESPVLQSWLLAPHLAPFGDGFWAVLLQKKS